MRLALCQIDPTVGDLEGNAALIRTWAEAAAAAGADLAVFPEQCLAGYPADDLLLKRSFLERCGELVAELAADAPLPMLVGYPEWSVDVFNSAALLAGGEVVGVYRKQHLPNYAVFDEHRHFRRGTRPAVVDVAGVRVGITICEDLWLGAGPASDEALAGADVIVNLSASPYRLDRGHERERLVASRAVDAVACVALCNLVGGQDELVFDGHSIAVDHTGAPIARGRQFAPELVLVDLPVDAARSARLHESRNRSLVDTAAAGAVQVDVLPAVERPAPASRDGLVVDPGIAVRGAGTDVPAVADLLDADGEVWNALVTGLADYVGKNGFRSVLVGLSGGIDSALVLALAVDALGADRVHAVTMPSRYSSGETKGDAYEMAERLGIDFGEIAIEPMLVAYLDALEPELTRTRRPGDDDGGSTTEENLQARIRGTLLMGLSNARGHLLLTTGNKSEVSVGYMTLYGDMAGGFAPIKDVPKTLVWQLARWRNAQAEAAGEAPVVPPSTIERPPTAELREGQADTDSLPPYDVLDPLLELLVEGDVPLADIVAAGYDVDLVQRIARLVDLAEYKRRQAPPGVRVTARAFGRDRRVPITNAFRDRTLHEA